MKISFLSSFYFFCKILLIKKIIIFTNTLHIYWFDEFQQRFGIVFLAILYFIFKFNFMLAIDNFFIITFVLT